MEPGAITSYIDVAQLALYAFWLFFAGLVYYLLKENKREGYPLITDRKNIVVEGFPFMPKPKAFHMPGNHTVYAPKAEQPEPLNAVPAANFPGAPFVPLGDPMLSGMGPGAWANRADVPDLAWDDQLPKIVPLRAAPAFFLASEDPPMMGYEVRGLDDLAAGRVVDAWIDRSEVVVRYVEVELADTRHVLLPLNYMSIDKRAQVIRTSFITTAQFSTVPTTREKDTVTLLEEDKIQAYYAGGILYAKAGRADPIL